MQDLWLMVMSKALIGTSGSTVSDVVRGYRQALNFDDNHVAVYGEWPVITRPTAEAQHSVRKLGALIARSTFDPNMMRISHEQLNTLRVLGHHHARELDVAIARLQQEGTSNASAVANTLYGELAFLNVCRQEFNKAARPTADRVEAPAHFFGALISNFLNPYLAETQAAHTWSFDGKFIRRVPPFAAELGLAGARSKAPSVTAGRMQSYSKASSSASQRPRVVPPPARML